MGVVGGESPPGARSPCCHVTTTSQRLPNETGEGGTPGRAQGGENQHPQRGGPRLRDGRGERKEGGAEGRGRYRQTEARYGQARGGAGQG